REDRPTAEGSRPRGRLGLGRPGAPLRGLDEPEPMGHRRRLQASRCAELAQDVRDMHAGSVLADEQATTDLAVRQPGDQKAENLELAGGQPEGGVGLRRGVNDAPLTIQVNPRPASDLLDLPTKRLSPEIGREAMPFRERTGG